MIHDIISIFSSKLNQCIKNNKYIFSLPLTYISLSISSILYKDGFISKYQIDKRKNIIIISLNKIDDFYPFSKIKRISKLSRKVYWPVSILKSKIIKEGRYYIISTHIGIISSIEALNKNISGEILIEIFL
jgi:ribosomal protein S8